MKVNKIAVAEMFASIQGEGPSMGVPSIFLRLGGCNLMCGGKGTEHDKQLHNSATWRCDSIEVWRKSKAYDIEELFNKMNEDLDLLNRMENGWHLIITGGEPLMQQVAIIELIDLIRFSNRTLKNFYFEIETNGTITPSEDLIDVINQWNVSPKLKNSGEEYNRRITPALKRFGNLTTSKLKLVISNENDINEALKITTENDFTENENVWLMPSASTREELIAKSAWLVKRCMELNMNYSPRLQLVVWDQTTGV